ncbi:hypothetical protein [Haladaptatus salinisoli]|uniref:hypothetical protein n=1 Tax=Haladaptatus salinisoli TaxID=2884876 RepID=UPI001D0B99C3|nr:hypothetical protein [Haladaptatus salinisoli]
MSAYNPAVQEPNELQANQTRVGEMLIVECAPDVYNVINESYDDPKEHTYTVTDGRCTCPQFKYRCADTGRTCKHQDAVESAKECDCDVLWEKHGVPCWPCYQSGKEFDDE